MTDLERFVALYASVGVALVPEPISGFEAPEHFIEPGYRLCFGTMDLATWQEDQFGTYAAIVFDVNGKFRYQTIVP